ncbi:MAG: DUF721 domain-containing protein [Nitrospinaceae bacterium]|jgi:hypothetical protein|nr:DUF721 domain-containing protein [Nitrospinaceae bacterium]MBT3434206.1 DUF721 domain-containing protein [Nitrospinaceae bacterium]MBT3820050.1 DUF721 domain-containing protein [Nitrospinaceae bacterium]MBT4093522.1 DUF721 domain-containing protein [Nitrospinaceae bacterium]MBT4431872.1 DUF721 domain-containing protein [Nitrospinaceae bacterium]
MNPSNKWRQPKGLSGILSELRRSEKWGRKLSGHFVFRIWDEVVGEAVAKVAHPVSLSSGCLRVEVSSSAWLQELHLMKADILFKLNDSMDDAIKEIIFVAGSGKPDGDGIDRSSHSGYATRSVPTEAEISADDEIASRAVMEEFNDPELREGIEKLMTRARRRVSEDVLNEHSEGNGPE